MIAASRRTRLMRATLAAVVVAGIVGPVLAGTAYAGPRDPGAKFVPAAAADTSAPLTQIALRAQTMPAPATPHRDELGPVPTDRGHSTDGALQSSHGDAIGVAAVPAPSVSFEGLANTDNTRAVTPPDPVGDVGPNHYVEMVNLRFAVYSKTGTRLLGPLSLGALWQGFGMPDCAREAGDPIVLHDQLADRWLLSQFTSVGPTFYNCVAVSATADPTGAYHRYAFSSGENFPDYPKYGVWPNAYFLSTREFAPAVPGPGTFFAGVGAYALERDRMLAGREDARMVRFLLPPGDKPYLPGDGLLPADLDGKRRPPAGSPNYFVGTQDDDGLYRAPFDALNVFQVWVSWGRSPVAAFIHSATVPVAEFDSIFPCGPPPLTRACIPQPGTANKLDILSYRQRPTWRLAYRNFGSHEALVTNQSVEATPGITGVRWYEIHRPGDQPLVFQQGTYAPADGTHRWMASVAQDKKGNMAVGFSVSSATVFPGIRYTGRLRDDPANQLPQGEASLIEGRGSQIEEPDPTRTTTQRWGDYTSMNVDPVDDCIFWYVNEYYAVSSPRFWQTRIGAFRLPGCR